MGMMRKGRGRPPIKLSRYGTDQANTGRDPLGKAGLTV